MLQLRTQQPVLSKHGGLAGRCALSAPRRFLVLAASTSHDDAWRQEKQVRLHLARLRSHLAHLPPMHDWQEWLARERVLLSELSAVRAQVDKLLDQQQVLLSMVAAASGLPHAAGRLPDSRQHPSSPLAPQPAAHTISPHVATPSHPASQAAASTAHQPQTPTATTSGGSTAMRQLFEDWGVGGSQAPFEPKATSMIADALREAGGGNGSSGAAWQSELPGQPGPAATPAASAASEPVSVKPAIGERPPELMLGEDDIYWMNHLHTSLLEAGYNCGEEEVEVWEFGEGTREALLAFQASVSLPETGMADHATWRALLAEVPQTADAIARDIAQGTVPTTSAPKPASSGAAATSNGGSSSGGSSAHTPTLHVHVDVDLDLPGQVGSAGGQHGPAEVDVALSVAQHAAATAAAALPSRVDVIAVRKELTKWPVLQDGDGGIEVKALQAALDSAGFYCGEEEMQWWQMGDATRAALQAFQASVSLPESGVCDARTWLALLGEHAVPSDLLSATEGGSDAEEDYSTDMTNTEGRVWLLGEQRWEKRRI